MGMEPQLPARARVLAFSLCALLGACHAPPSRSVTLLATVVRIEQPQGEFFSPRMPGPARTLTKVYLRPIAGGSPGESLVVVAVLGRYTPAALGGPGDVV